MTTASAVAANVVCVLGCRPGSAALARRARAARDAFFAQRPSFPASFVIACGGVADVDGRVEADELARMLVDGGVPEDAIVRERVSRDTRGNAIEARRILRERRMGGEDGGLETAAVVVFLVTCSWHLPRATKLFERAGITSIVGVGAEPPNPTLFKRAWWAARERVSSWKMLITTAFALFLCVSCTRSSSTTADASADGGGAVSTTKAFDPVALSKAEDGRHAKDVPPEIRTSHDVVARRKSARVLARIADAQSVDGLVAHLADEDPETMAWAAYGLGYACKGREDAHVRILSARGAALVSDKAAPPAATRGAAEMNPHVAIARAIGRCGGGLSEQVLVSLLQSGLSGKAAWTDPALLGLGDLAVRRTQLSADTLAALLEAANEKSAGPHDLVFYAFGRSTPGEAFANRIAEAARVALGRPGPSRILAIRTLARAGKEKDAAKDTATELAKIVVDAKGFGHGERAEAARGLGGLGDAGQTAIAGAIAELTPDAKDPIAITDLSGPSFVVLYTLLSALGPEAPKKAEASLQILATLEPPTQPKPGFAHRLADIRCTAALALAKGAYDADVLKKCNPETSEASQRARLTALLRRQLTKERLTAFRAFARSEHLRIREEAVEALGSHGEVGEAGISIIADALGSKHAGLVATAAEMLNQHPERAMVLAESEKRAALDPKSPPPTANPAQEVSAQIVKALTAALAEKWPEDRFETRNALVEAAANMRLPNAKEVATTACNDANPVVRERGMKALRMIAADVKACEAADREPKLATEIGATLAKQAKIILTTDVGELTLILEPELSPITATRITSLAKSGFFKGIVVHRVVPGFVVQLGDPEGDGYGGSGTSLRCETSPVPFNLLDIGMALAGRDTGSSQFFITLSRTPHLDGEYTRVGRAEGDWASVAQGDVISDARVVE